MEVLAGGSLCRDSRHFTICIVFQIHIYSNSSDPSTHLSHTHTSTSSPPSASHQLYTPTLPPPSLCVKISKDWDNTFINNKNTFNGKLYKCNPNIVKLPKYTPSNPDVPPNQLFSLLLAIAVAVAIAAAMKGCRRRYHCCTME